jgi:uncharacterized iron-regulated membrane protein
MTRSVIRTIIRRLHLYLGLSLGGLFVLLGLTGSVLVFYTEIDQWLHPEIQVAQRDSIDWDRAVQTVRNAFPEKDGPWRFEVTGDGGAIPARYNNPPETAGRDFAPMLVWLSPDGRRVLRTDYWGDTAMTFIYDLHYRLLIEKTGGVIVGYAGLGLFALLLSGLWAWWPKAGWRKALRYKFGAAPIRSLRDQHKLAGLLALPMLLLLTVTGAMLALPDESDSVLAATIAPIDALPKPVSTQSSGSQIALSVAMQRAAAALPQGRIAWVEIPGPGNGAFRVRFQVPGDPSVRFPRSFVWIDQYTGDALAVADMRQTDASTWVNNWLHPLHEGSAGGLPLRVVTAIVGPIPLILFVTGFRRWRGRRARR